TACFPAPRLERSEFQSPENAGGGGVLVGSRSLLRLAERHYQQTVSFADGSRMGKRGPRRHRGIRVSLGKLAAGRASRLCQPLEKRAGASRSLCDKRIRALEHGRQRARMVRRLVRRQL